MPVDIDVVVGGGGPTAARAAADLGASVVVLGKLDLPGGNSRLSTGSIPGARVSYLDDSAGRFTPDLLRYFVSNLADRDAYLCGPPPTASAVREGLRAAGLPDSQLH